MEDRGWGQKPSSIFYRRSSVQLVFNGHLLFTWSAIMRMRPFIKWIIFGTVLLLLGFFVGLPVYNTKILTIRHEEVRIKSGDVELAATISMPRWGSGPFPALVSVHGSGPMRRQDISGDWRNLVPHGMVVLTYDKRGVGESSGRFGEVRTEFSEAWLGTLATDARACLEFLKRHPRVDPQRVGFFGGSQASWIIPIASDGQTDVAFNVILAGAATSVGVETYYSSMTGDGRRPVEALSPEEIERRLQSYDGPTGFDPLPVLRRAKTPSLWLLGARDLSTPAERSSQNLEELRKQGAPITVKVYPNGNHGLHDISTGRRLPFYEDTVEWLHKQEILRR
jgi:dienelactone hydrolase